MSACGRGALRAACDHSAHGPLEGLRLPGAELYRDRGQPDAALAWAEKGLAAFPVQTDPRLREFLADAYEGAGRHADAMGVIW